MPTHQSIRRNYLIFEKVTKSNFPGFREIHDYFLENDIEISHRTLQRDISHLRSDFGIDIVYDKEKNGYYLDKYSTTKPEVFLRFLEIVTVAGIFTDNLKDSSELLKHVHFDALNMMEGIHQINPILMAIKDSKIIQFSHFSFVKNVVSLYSLQPYLLKEYQNRWYVVGKPYPYVEFRTFGIDRISELKITEETFERAGEKPEIYFDNIIGLQWNDGNVETVKFSVLKFHDNYMKTLPLHKTQRIVDETETETVFELDVIINFELIQKFLMQASFCKVLSPQHLVDEMKGYVSEMLDNYS